MSSFIHFPLGILGTLLGLFILHRKLRDQERERRIQYWREQVRALCCRSLLCTSLTKDFPERIPSEPIADEGLGTRVYLRHARRCQRTKHAVQQRRAFG